MESLKVPSNNNSNKEYKLCILGEGGVGKSSLVSLNNYSIIKQNLLFLDNTICSRDFC